MEHKLLKNWNKNDSLNTTLIILAVDSFVHTLRAKFFDNFHALDCVLPLFAPNPFSVENQQPFVTGFTGYYSAAENLLLLQQRSDFVEWKKKEFLNRFMDWLKYQRFKSIVLLCGCFAYARNDEELRCPSTIRYLCTQEAESLYGKSLPPEFRMQKRLNEIVDDNDERNGRAYHLPGGGIAEALYYKCVEEKLPFSIFLNYVNEGTENDRDALDLAKFCDDTLHLRQNSKESFRGPPSWIKNDVISDDVYS